MKLPPFLGNFHYLKHFFLVESFIWNTRKYIENTFNSIQWYVGRHRNLVTSSSSNEASTSSIAASVTSSDGFAMNEAASRNSHLAHYTNATHVSLTPREAWVRIRVGENYIFFLFSGFWIFSEWWPFGSYTSYDAIWRVWRSVTITRRSFWGRCQWSC